MFFGIFEFENRDLYNYFYLYFKKNEMNNSQLNSLFKKVKSILMELFENELLEEAIKEIKIYMIK